MTNDHLGDGDLAAEGVVAPLETDGPRKDKIRRGAADDMQIQVLRRRQ